MRPRHTLALATALFATGLPQAQALAQAQAPATAAATPACAVNAPALAAGQHSGGCQDGRAHGPGRVTDPATGHTLFEGDFHQGDRHGQGRYSPPGGDTYQGQWQRDQRHGHGRLDFGPASPWHGDRYEGQWQANQFHGQGRYRWVHGDVYEGPWKEGQQTGPATAGQQRRAAYLAALLNALPATQHHVCALAPTPGQPGTPARARVLSVVEDRLQLQPQPQPQQQPPQPQAPTQAGANTQAPPAAPFWSPAAAWRPCAP